MTITPESVKALLESGDFGDRLRAVNQMRQLDPAIAFDLIQIAATDSSVRVRYAAVSQLASLGSQNPDMALDLLQASLRDSEPDVQAAAADSIGALKLTAAYEDLKALYHRSTEWLVQFSIIAALGELGDPSSFDLLQEALGSTNELVRTAAIGSLGELGDPRAIPLLTAYATHPDWQIRHRVVQALGHFQTPEARAVLEGMVNDDNSAVAQEVKLYL
ncbi:HEAT repeat domain-containing protein [Thermoleptolyngbya oregonensis NK1-22]|uniref:HEAT repeat domain-containing protein n=1 Tax=Thermoleptolyngbya oregonensis NK1-22 TaxID=2547457 RepID=A0AA96Y1K3_9CYAN|nr:HEAT repeat domain-containing protein [Thermoleptolyngbya oregonensis]WOB42692.1 HEAT repeat domain-containing protein [Thermoleptolyngbya oregonensis NK1-22]